MQYICAYERVYLTNETFCLGLLRSFVVSYCFSTTEATHSGVILLRNILLTVLQVFQFYLILLFFTPPNLNLFSISLFSEIYYTFSYMFISDF